ncbi:hypothetical protein C8R44DRAFT_734085 [Mycena epipterygia]|nr:hypothetical protein C8R44DRAFT_734085 [Mycena epipterygia]
MHNFRPVFPEEALERYPSLTMALGNDYPGSYTTDVVAASDSCSDLDAAMSPTAASSFINPPLTRPSSLTSEACFVHRPVPGTIFKISASHLWTADGIPSATIASHNNPAFLDNYPMRKDPYNFASKATYNLPNPRPAFRHDTTSKCVPKSASASEKTRQDPRVQLMPQAIFRAGDSQNPPKYAHRRETYASIVFITAKKQFKLMYTPQLSPASFPAVRRNLVRISSFLVIIA